MSKRFSSIQNEDINIFIAQHHSTLTLSGTDKDFFLFDIIMYRTTYLNKKAMQYSSK